MDGDKNANNSDNDSKIKTDSSLADEQEVPNDNDNPKGHEDSTDKKNKYFIFNWQINSDTIINVAQAVFTIFILFIAVGQNRYAREAAEAAIKATNIADSTYKLSVRSSKESDSIGRVRFKMDSLTYQAQINAMNEQIKILKDQFEIENTPYLRVEIEKLDIEINKALNITYFTFNLGKHPVRVNSTKISVIALDKSIAPVYKNIFADVKEQKVNFYITNQFPHGTNFLPEFIVDKMVYDKLDSKQWFLYLAGEEIYTNLINGKPRMFRFLIRFDVVKQPIGITVLENENIPIN